MDAIKTPRSCSREFDSVQSSKASGGHRQQRMDSFKEWFSDQKSKACVVEMTSKLWKRADQYAIAYEHPNCYRTSNQVDRPMNRIKRVFYSTLGVDCMVTDDLKNCT